MRNPAGSFREKRGTMVAARRHARVAVRPGAANDPGSEKQIDVLRKRKRELKCPDAANDPGSEKQIDVLRKRKRELKCPGERKTGILPARSVLSTLMPGGR